MLSHRSHTVSPRVKWLVGVTALVAAGLAAGAGTPPATTRAPWQPVEVASPAPPAACRPLPSGSALQAEIDAAPEGAALCLAPGTWKGPVRIDKKLTLWGPRSAVIRTHGEGTTVRITGAGAALLGVTIDGSGDRYDLQDAAVLVEGDQIRVEGVRIEHAIFGILLQKSKHGIVRSNAVIGTDEGPLGLRGDGIHLWETYDSRVEGNYVTHSRDMVVWYSSRNHLADNTVQNSRYGTHLMYSHDNVLERNHYLRNVVGVFVMYSRNLQMRDNFIAGSAGAAGVGLGVKESGNLTVTGNQFIYNTIGASLDTTPLQLDDHNVFERNVFRLGDIGVFFLSSQHRNLFRNNDFRDNYTQVSVEGGGDALGVEWEGNNFDDYAGYDLDGDGTGDIPYQLRSLSNQVTNRYPAIQFFRGMLALNLVDAVGHIVPLYQPKTILIDKAPRMAALSLEVPRAD